MLCCVVLCCVVLYCVIYCVCGVLCYVLLQRLRLHRFLLSRIPRWRPHFFQLWQFTKKSLRTSVKSKAKSVLPIILVSSIVGVGSIASKFYHIDTNFTPIQKLNRILFFFFSNTARYMTPKSSKNIDFVYLGLSYNN